MSCSAVAALLILRQFSDPNSVCRRLAASCNLYHMIIFEVMLSLKPKGQQEEVREPGPEECLLVTLAVEDGKAVVL